MLPDGGECNSASRLEEQGLHGSVPLMETASVGGDIILASSLKDFLLPIHWRSLEEHSYKTAESKAPNYSAEVYKGSYRM